MLPSKITDHSALINNIIDNLDKRLKGWLGIKEDTFGSAVFDHVYDFGLGAAPTLIPIIGGYINHRRIRKVEKGLEQLNEIAKQSKDIPFKETEIEFIQDKALPFILKNIAEEEQDEKIKILTNGFESVIYDSMYNEDSLYEYYDVLKSLRIKDIARMIQLYNAEFKDQETYNIGNFEFDGTSLEYIDNKLEQLGIRRTVIFDDGTWESEIKKEEISSFTDFGQRFIKFFRNRRIEE